MNGAEQRERFTAVSRAEKRLDNLEIVVEALAKEMVVEREARNAAITGTRKACDGRGVDQERMTLKIFKHLSDLQQREDARVAVMGSGFRGRMGLVGRLLRWGLTGKSWH